MADLWEVCRVNGNLSNLVYLWYPGKPRTVKDYREFMRSQGIELDKKGRDKNGNEAPSSMIIGLLLSAGWEPYAVSEGYLFFRRKLSL